MVAPEASEFGMALAAPGERRFSSDRQPGLSTVPRFLSDAEQAGIKWRKFRWQEQIYDSRQSSEEFLGVIRAKVR